MGRTAREPVGAGARDGRHFEAVAEHCAIYPLFTEGTAARCRFWLRCSACPLLGPLKFVDRLESWVGLGLMHSLRRPSFLVGDVTVTTQVCAPICIVEVSGCIGNLSDRDAL